MAKANLIKLLKPVGFLVVNIDYPNSRAIGNTYPKKYWQISSLQHVQYGCFVRDDAIWWTDGKETLNICPTDDIFIPGKHNWENVMAACAGAKASGVSWGAIRKTIKEFKGLPHRIEFVSEAGGVRYYDDSFSTTPETAIAAIHAFIQPKVLILGGSSKNSDFTELGTVISKSKSIRAIIGIGVEWERIKQTIGSGLPVVEHLKIIRRLQEHGRDSEDSEGKQQNPVMSFF